jgi:hypothetical protein
LTSPKLDLPIKFRGLTILVAIRVLESRCAIAFASLPPQSAARGTACTVAKSHLCRRVLLSDRADVLHNLSTVRIGLNAANEHRHPPVDGEADDRSRFGSE